MATMLHLALTDPRAMRLRRRAAKARSVTAGARRKEHQAASPNGAKLAYMRGLRPLIEGVWNMLVQELLGRQDALDNLRVRVVEKIQREAPSLIGEIGRRVSRQNLKEQSRLIGIDPRIDPGTGPVIDGFRRENVQLITNLTDDMRNRVEAIVRDRLAGRVENLSEELQDGLGFARARANLIARDQTLKLNGQLTKVRQQNAGIEEYIWTTSGDERVRDSHEALDGQRFRWDNPPSVGHPGQDFQCRCTSFPVIPGLEET